MSGLRDTTHEAAATQPQAYLMTPEQFQAGFKKKFDLEAGQRKLSCLSR